jgi:SAM-dependent methyltransferase
MTGLYRDTGLEIYEKSHYSNGEHIEEVEKILTWYRPRNTQVLDIGCSAGLHALEMARRGFSVSGLDIEPSAIERAKKRNKGMRSAEFRVMDIESHKLSRLGKFSLIYSLGNVLSHIRKDSLLKVLWNIRKCLDKNGTFLFDILINSRPFQEEMHPGESDLQVIWKRKIDRYTGRISMDGIFLEFGFTQHFDVWGYYIDEIRYMLESSGFKNIEFSEKLDFTEMNTARNPISLYFRAKG